MNNKESFNIEEVCEIVGVMPHVIHYWETEFLQLRPVKNKSRQRIYSRKDVEVIRRIYSLLFEGKHSIQDSKIVLAKEFETAGDVPINQDEKNLAEFGVRELFWLYNDKKSQAQ
jgi:DNA-binding transcriptional MerR regulator